MLPSPSRRGNPFRSLPEGPDMSGRDLPSGDSEEGLSYSVYRGHRSYECAACGRRVPRSSTGAVYVLGDGDGSRGRRVEPVCFERAREEAGLPPVPPSEPNPVSSASIPGARHSAPPPTYAYDPAVDLPRSRSRSSARPAGFPGFHRGRDRVRARGSPTDRARRLARPGEVPTVRPRGQDPPVRRNRWDAGRRRAERPVPTDGRST